ncbi:MAG: hypothetical protein WED00_11615 [Aquisalimonadaceae bacterium]
MVTDTPEVQDDEHAPASIRALYDDIRGTLETDVINLVFRRLAAIDGCLAQVWERLRPAYRDGTLDALGADLLSAVQPLPQVSLPAAVLQAVALDPGERAQICAVVAAYNRNNARNLIAFKALLVAGGPAHESARVATRLSSGQVSAIPPLPALKDLPLSSRELLAALNALGEAGSPAVVAGLFRHLAHWPGALVLAAGLLTPLHGLGWLAQRTEAVTNAANRMARELPASMRDPAAITGSAAGVMPLIDSTIPKMIPVGLVLDGAFRFNQANI